MTSRWTTYNNEEKLHKMTIQVKARGTELYIKRVSMHSSRDYTYAQHGLNIFIRSVQLTATLTYMYVYTQIF